MSFGAVLCGCVCGRVKARRAFCLLPPAAGNALLDGALYLIAKEIKSFVRKVQSRSRGRASEASGVHNCCIISHPLTEIRLRP